MQLLYLWLEKYNNIENQGFNFSQDFEIQYSKESNELTFNKKENQLPENFFAKNISSVTAIVGKNGTGKSSILAAICYFLANTAEKIENEIQNRIVLCFLKEEEKVIYCFDGVIQNGTCAFHNKQKIQHLNEYDGYKIKKVSEIAVFEYEKFREGVLGLLYAVQTTVEYSNVAEQSMLFLTSEGLKIRENLNESMQRHQGWKESIENKMLFNLWKQFGKKPNSIWPEDGNGQNLPYTPEISLAGLANDRADYYGITEGKEKILKYFVCILEEFFLQIYKPYPGYYRTSAASRVIDDAMNTKNLTQKHIDAIINEISGPIVNPFEAFTARNMPPYKGQFQTFFTNLMLFVDAVDKTEYKLRFEKKYFMPQDLNANFLNLDFLEDNDLAKKFIKLLKETETFLPNFFIIKKEEIYSTGQQVRLNMLSRLYWYVDAEMLKEKKHILLMIDEGEATLHPEWQRHYFSWVLDLCKELKKEVQLIFTTHSPFLLADIPKQNVIALKNGGEETLAKETFAANIHAMLAHSFFMSGTMGEFAFKKMKGVIDFLQSDKNNDRELKSCKAVIDLIGEPILRNKLLELYHDKLPNGEKIKALKLEIKRLEEEERQRKEKEDSGK